MAKKKRAKTKKGQGVKVIGGFADGVKEKPVKLGVPFNLGLGRAGKKEKLGSF